MKWFLNEQRRKLAKLEEALESVDRKVEELRVEVARLRRERRG